jgi:hypothetical protein
MNSNSVGSFLVADFQCVFIKIVSLLYEYIFLICVIWATIYNFTLWLHMIIEFYHIDKYDNVEENFPAMNGNFP